jgi:hypothetical protein
MARFLRFALVLTTLAVATGACGRSERPLPSAPNQLAPVTRLDVCEPPASVQPGGGCR